MRTEYTYQAGGTTWTVGVERRADQFQVTIADRVYELKLLPSETGLLYFQLNGLPYSVGAERTHADAPTVGTQATQARQIRAYIAQAGSRRYVAIAGESWQLERATRQSHSRRVGSGGAATSGALAAEMPGQVLELLVKPGDLVAAGQTLVLLEAMKMELRITAPAAGQIRQVYCTQGQVVERGQTLIEFEMMSDEG
jgi:biotin carboxyl carrier protein